jgi:hypothetical protein
MMFLNVLDANDQLLEAELDGLAYYLGISWNEAGQLWSLSVRDLDRQLLVSGIRVVPLYPLLQQVRRPELPPGEIVVDCAEGYTLKRDSFASGAAGLWYFDTVDLAEIASAEV